jgi:hypothetical protein
MNSGCGKKYLQTSQGLSMINSVSGPFDFYDTGAVEIILPQALNPELRISDQII